LSRATAASSFVFCTSHNPQGHEEISHNRQDAEVEEDVQGGDPFDDHVYKKDDKAPREIAALLHRSKSSVTRHLFVKTASATQGRKPNLTEAHWPHSGHTVATQ
jgi:hypothetical protein